MSSLLREVIPLALAAAISPVIFLLQLNTLTGQRPIARGAALTAGAAINIGFGALLMAVGLRALLRPPKPKAPTTDAKPPSVGGSFLAGAGGHGLEPHHFRALHPRRWP